MKARAFGRIIQIDSEVVDRPPPGRSAYATAKSAQIGLTRSWARELAEHGITVNTIAPGFVPVERHADVPDEVKDAYLATVPAGRLGTPEDIAHAVSFFATDAAGFITGQRLLVDGGRALRDEGAIVRGARGEASPPRSGGQAPIEELVVAPAGNAGRPDCRRLDARAASTQRSSTCVWRRICTGISQPERGAGAPRTGRPRPSGGSLRRRGGRRRDDRRHETADRCRELERRDGAGRADPRSRRVRQSATEAVLIQAKRGAGRPAGAADDVATLLRARTDVKNVRRRCGRRTAGRCSCSSTSGATATRPTTRVAAGARRRRRACSRRIRAAPSPSSASASADHALDETTGQGLLAGGAPLRAGHLR